MKKTLTILLVIMVALALAVPAMAETFTPAAGHDQEVAPPTQQYHTPSNGGSNNAAPSNAATRKSTGTQLAPGEREGTHMPDGSIPGINPDGSVGGIAVEIVASDNNPQLGANIELGSRIWNNTGLPLYYQWQMDRGNGWEHIEGATAPRLIFNYNETTATWMIRLCVDTQPIL